MRNVEPNFTNLLPSQPAHQTKTAWYVSMTVTDVWILAVSIVLAILLSPRDVVPWKLDSFIDTLWLHMQLEKNAHFGPRARWNPRVLNFEFVIHPLYLVSVDFEKTSASFLWAFCRGPSNWFSRLPLQLVTVLRLAQLNCPTSYIYPNSLLSATSKSRQNHSFSQSLSLFLVWLGSQSMNPFIHSLQLTLCLPHWAARV